MNALSWILICAAALWFIAAVIWIARRKGNTCACGKSCAGCADCGHCRKKPADR